VVRSAAPNMSRVGTVPSPSPCIQQCYTGSSDTATYTARLMHTRGQEEGDEVLQGLFHGVYSAVAAQSGHIKQGVELNVDLHHVMPRHIKPHQTTSNRRSMQELIYSSVLPRAQRTQRAVQKASQERWVRGPRHAPRPALTAWWRPWSPISQRSSRSPSTRRWP
jgi:hypothetical protein